MLALHFGAHRHPSQEWSLPQLHMEGPETASSGSSCDSSCSSLAGIRAEGVAGTSTKGWGQETHLGRQRGWGQLRGCPLTPRQHRCSPGPSDVGPPRCTGARWCQSASAQSSSCACPGQPAGARSGFPCPGQRGAGWIGRPSVLLMLPSSHPRRSAPAPVAARAAGAGAELGATPRYGDGGCPQEPWAPALQLMAGMLQSDGNCGHLGVQELLLSGGRPLMVLQMV